MGTSRWPALNPATRLLCDVLMKGAALMHAVSNMARNGARPVYINHSW